MQRRLPGPIAVLMPERWRERLPHADSIHWREAAQISGLVQTIVFLAAYVVWFVYSMGHWARAAIVASMRGNSQVSVGLGTFVALGFVLVAMSPLTWVLWYFAGEGLNRVLKARAMERTRGTLPLRLAEHVAHLVKFGKWSTTPALVKDKVDRHGLTGDLRIASCRAKENWKYPLTIRYEDEFFQVQGEEHFPMEHSRPHVYRLKKLPNNEIIRGLEEYDPEDVLHEEKVPGFFASVAGELRKKWS